MALADLLTLATLCAGGPRSSRRSSGATSTGSWRASGPSSARSCGRSSARIYRVCGIDETAEQGWKGYAVSVLVMAFVAIVAGYVVLRLQDVLPLNPGGVAAACRPTSPSTPRSASRPTRTGRTTRARPARAT